MKIKLSGAKKISNTSDQIRLGEFWTKAHYVDLTGIIGTRLKDIEPQQWMSEMNNDIRRDADQNDKMGTYRKFKTIENYKCKDYLCQATNTRHRITLTKLRLRNHKLSIETG